MERIILGSIFIAVALTGSVFASYYNPYIYRSERTDRQMEQLQRDVDRMPQHGCLTPDGSGGYYYTY